MSVTVKRARGSRLSALTGDERLRAILGRDPLALFALRFLGFSPVSTAIATMMVGFGVLCVGYLYLLVTQHPLADLRGLFSYYTSSIGDGLLLPVAVAITILTYRELLEMVRHAPSGLGETGERITKSLSRPVITWSPLLVAVLTVTGIHWAWLGDPSIGANWTIPEPHTLNSAGVYHAVFMTLVLWWFGAFAIRLGLVGTYILRPSHHKSNIDQRFLHATVRAWKCTLGLWVVLAAFAGLLYIDNYGLTLSMRTILTSPSTALTVGLVAPALAGIWLVGERWVIPLAGGVLVLPRFRGQVSIRPPWPCLN